MERAASSPAPARDDELAGWVCFSRPPLRGGSGVVSQYWCPMEEDLEMPASQPQGAPVPEGSTGSAWNSPSRPSTHCPSASSTCGWQVTATGGYPSPAPSSSHSHSHRQHSWAGSLYGISQPSQTSPSAYSAISSCTNSPAPSSPSCHWPLEQPCGSRPSDNNADAGPCCLERPASPCVLDPPELAQHLGPAEWGDNGGGCSSAGSRRSSFGVPGEQQPSNQDLSWGARRRVRWASPVSPKEEQQEEQQQQGWQGGLHYTRPTTPYCPRPHLYTVHAAPPLLHDNSNPMRQPSADSEGGESTYSTAGCAARCSPTASLPWGAESSPAAALGASAYSTPVEPTQVRAATPESCTMQQLFMGIDVQEESKPSRPPTAAAPPTVCRPVAAAVRGPGSQPCTPLYPRIYGQDQQREQGEQLGFSRALEYGYGGSTGATVRPASAPLVGRHAPWPDAACQTRPQDKYNQCQQQQQQEEEDQQQQWAPLAAHWPGAAAGGSPGTMQGGGLPYIPLPPSAHSLPLGEEGKVVAGPGSRHAAAGAAEKKPPPLSLHGPDWSSVKSLLRNLRRSAGAIDSPSGRPRQEESLAREEGGSRSPSTGGLYRRMESNEQLHSGLNESSSRSSWRAAWRVKAVWSPGGSWRRPASPAVLEVPLNSCNLDSLDAGSFSPLGDGVQAFSKLSISPGLEEARVEQGIRRGRILQPWDLGLP